MASDWTMIINSCAFEISISPSGKIFVLKDSVLNMFPNYLYSSVDNGNTWTEVNLMAQLIDSIPDLNEPISITVSPTGIVFCGIRQGRKVNSTAIAKSDDDGLIWTTPGMRIEEGTCLILRGQFLIRNGHSMAPGAAGSYIYLSTDFGNTWNLLGYPPWTFINSLGFFTNGNMLIGGMGIHISTDICSTWTQIATLNIQSGLSWSSGLSEGMLFGTKI